MAHQTTDPLLTQRPEACNPAINAEYCSGPLPATAPAASYGQANGGRLDHIEMNAMQCGDYNRGIMHDRHQQYDRPVVVEVHGDRRNVEKSALQHINRKMAITSFSSIVISVVVCCLLYCFVLPLFGTADRPGCIPCSRTPSRRTPSTGTRSQRTTAMGDGDGRRTSTKTAACCSYSNDASSSTSVADVERMINEQIQKLRAKYNDGLNVNGQILLSPSQIECAAHVVSHAVSETTKPLDSDTDTIRSWDSRGDNSFTKPCITYDNATGRFTVAQPGVYFIYSHLSFLGPVSDKPYEHRVVVWHNSTGQRSPLLRESRSIAAWEPVDADAAVYTSNLQGLHSLRPLDALFVEAEPADRLDPTGRTYFGLYKLRDTASDSPENLSI